MMLSVKHLFDKEFQTIERQIDNLLAECFPRALTENGIWYCMQKGTTDYSGFLSTIIQRYGPAGWQIDIVCENEDMFLVFTCQVP